MGVQQRPMPATVLHRRLRLVSLHVLAGTRLNSHLPTFRRHRPRLFPSRPPQRPVGLCQGWIGQVPRRSKSAAADVNIQFVGVHINSTKIKSANLRHQFKNISNLTVGYIGIGNVFGDADVIMNRNYLYTLKVATAKSSVYLLKAAHFWKFMPAFKDCFTKL